MLRPAGRVACERLQPVKTAATILLRDGKVSVTDSPFRRD